MLLRKFCVPQVIFEPLYDIGKVPQGQAANYANKACYWEIDFMSIVHL